jgi:DMSO/TMAO reductase YedYZ molybdopterin-dependent catalytic subunit
MTRLSRLARVVCLTILMVSMGCQKTTHMKSSGDASTYGKDGIGNLGPSGADSNKADGWSCNPAPVVAPTLPAVIPVYLEQDPATGLHITGDYQVIDASSWRLKVTGKVDHPLSLSYDDLRCLPKKTETITIVCQGFFEDTANFSGVALTDILDLAGVQAQADTLVLKGADQYSTDVPLESARLPDNLIAYEWEGQPLPILHGFPARALFPQMPGSASVKWLLEIEATTAE